MRAEELMTGDYVLYRPKNAIMKVTAILPNQIAATCFDTEEPFYGNDFYIYFEPIPLTTEIFEKNGFELCKESWKSNYTFYFSKDKRVKISDLTNCGDGYWNVHVDNEDMETIGSCDVKYVHEMQNILRLCRYELDLKI